MEFEITNSENCLIDGKNMTYFRESIAILREIEETLKRVGPEKFFSSTDEKVKKVRESMAGLFFLFALQGGTDDFLFLMQPEKDPPDFVALTIGDHVDSMSVNMVELVEIPPRCNSFEEASEIVQKKIDKGYPKDYHLLIFINNEKSKEWLPSLKDKLKDQTSFRSIWSLHLLVDKGDWFPVLNRLEPRPIVHFETRISDLKFPSTLPGFMEQVNKGGKNIVTFKGEFMKAFMKKIRMSKLGNK